MNQKATLLCLALVHIAVCSATSAQSHQATWKKYSDAAERLVDKGRYQEAEAALRAAADQSRAFGAQDKLYADTLFKLAISSPLQRNGDATKTSPGFAQERSAQAGTAYSRDPQQPGQGLSGSGQVRPGRDALQAGIGDCRKEARTRSPRRHSVHRQASSSHIQLKASWRKQSR